MQHNYINTIISKKNAPVFVYYFILLLIMLSWTNPDSAPNVFFRVVYMLLLFIPLVKYNTLLPMVVTLFYTISAYSFSYNFLPSNIYIYALIILILWVFSKYTLTNNDQIFEGSKRFVFLCVFVLLVDLLNELKIQSIFYSIFICLLLSRFINYDKKTSIEYLALAFVTSTFILSLFYFIFGKNFIQEYSVGGIYSLDRITWHDPNYFGAVIGIGLLVAVDLLLRDKVGVSYKLYLVSTIILSIIALGVNASRGALLAVGISVLVLILKSKIKLIYKLLITLSIVALVYYLYSNQYLDLLIYRIEADDGTGSGRLDIWNVKISAFINNGNPIRWLFGYGYEGGFRLGFTQTGLGYFGFHNDFIAFLVDYGIVGIALFISVLILPLRLVSSQLRTTVISLIAYIVTICMTLEPLTAGRLPFFIFYFYIYLLAISNKKQQKSVTSY